MRDDPWTIKLPRAYFLRRPAATDLGIVHLLMRNGTGLYEVHNTSAVPIRRAVATLARYFRREFEYDFVQYQEQNEDGPDKCIAWLFVDRRGMEGDVAVGACCFRWREWTDRAPCWALQWIWFHPFARGKGTLSQAWPYFVRRFAPFIVEGPFSRAMEGFMVALGIDPDRAEVQRQCGSDVDPVENEPASPWKR